MFRLQSFTSAPWASVFIHWLIGMVYVFYFASFVILLREVLRPGVLWFLRNLNDPDFNPIQEMIHLSIPRHMRRYVALERSGPNDQLISQGSAPPW